MEERLWGSRVKVWNKSLSRTIYSTDLLEIKNPINREFMKAIAVFPSKKEIRLIDHAVPEIVSETQVKLRMLEVGICGTDKEICHFDYGLPPNGSEYLILGHESLGEVVEVGSGVSSLKPGDLVVTMVRRPCGHPECKACQEGRQDFCYTGDFFERGIKQAHGFMAEFVVDEEKYMNFVPQELREIAVLVEPLTIAEKALTEIFQVQQRLPWGCPGISGQPHSYCHRAVVLGAGPVGILGAMTLVAAGFQTFVYSQESVPSLKSELIEAIGATYVSAQTDSVEKLAERVGQIDVVYEAAGASQVAFHTLEVLGVNGIFVFTGVPGRKGPVSVDTDLIMRDMVLKNQVLFGSVNAGKSAYQAAIRDLTMFAKKWPKAVRSLITGRFPMESFADLLAGRTGGIKNVITLES